MQYKKRLNLISEWLLTMINQAQLTKNYRHMVTIGFSRATKEEKYRLYVDWLKSIDSSFEVINFYGMDIREASHTMEKCSGFVLTGGEDVHPLHYRKESEEHRCVCDPYRDKLELALIDKALVMKLPMLAICRGEQILNVSLGGDLIVDIVTDYGNTVNHKSDSDQLVYHRVNIEPSSNLYKISNAAAYDVVTIHHQAVKTLAPHLRAAAFADDGIVEAYEWLNPSGRGYLNAVQWHPERGDYTNALSQAIGKDFLEKAYAYSKV